MNPPRLIVLLWIGALLFPAACTKVDGFRCANDGDCGDDACFGFCARLDPDCASGFVYAPSAGSVAGQCVEVTTEDAGPSADAFVPATIIYVDASAADDSGDGTESMPYKTIARGLREAEAGAQVQVAPGLYNAANGEVFPLTVPAGVYLVGDQAGKGAGTGAETTIVGDAPVASTDFRAAVVASDGAFVAGFGFAVGDEVGTAGVLMLDVTAEVSDCTFTAGFAGVAISGAGDTLVRDSLFDMPEIEGGSLNPFQDESGIYGFEYSGRPVIDGNVVTGLGGGITMTGSGFATIRNNQISGANGVAIRATAARLQGNTIFNPTEACFVTYGEVVARGNNCAVDTGPGILVQSGDPDFGTQTDSGNNVFAGATTNAVNFATSANTFRTVTAIGNAWFGSAELDCAMVFAFEGDRVLWSSADGGQVCPP
ncbi:MAG: DUF1565 domain-containing protein [Deltaproteobacteria bacterium]|nr:DUF1565 domain-containing protein [Deltaproteobacteria bacterium]